MFAHRPADGNAHNRARRETISGLFARGFAYSRRLSAHTSCVNALCFSSGDGRWLASGGDDFCIRLWDFHQDDVKEPSHAWQGPKGNVFSLAFSATNQYLYSGGTDDIILKYDTARLDSSTPIASTFRVHTDSIRAISCHPFHDEVFMSGSEDGNIILHDNRAESSMTRAQATLMLPAEVTGVQYHPSMEHVFATSDSRGRVCLRDIRMAFGPLRNRTRDGVVQNYHTRLSSKSLQRLSNPEGSSLTFDRDGQKLAVTMLHYLPTLYGLSDPMPIAICSGRNLPDATPAAPERTYSNSCTIKHGSFGGPGLDGDAYYAAGSDDFRGYVWKIPGVRELTEDRQEVSADDWMGQEWADAVAFAEHKLSSRYIPRELSTPHFRLNGHDSIVNTALIHPHLLHIVTSGIERHIVLHSPTPSSPCCIGLPLTPTEVRALPVDVSTTDRIRAIHSMMNPDYSPEEGDDDVSTIALFDEILRQEGNTDIFAAREWESDSDDDDAQIGAGGE